MVQLKRLVLELTFLWHHIESWELIYEERDKKPEPTCLYPGQYQGQFLFMTRDKNENCWHVGSILLNLLACFYLYTDQVHRVQPLIAWRRLAYRLSTSQPRERCVKLRYRCGWLKQWVTRLSSTSLFHVWLR